MIINIYYLINTNNNNNLIIINRPHSKFGQRYMCFVDGSLIWAYSSTETQKSILYLLLLLFTAINY